MSVVDISRETDTIDWASLVPPCDPCMYTQEFEDPSWKVERAEYVTIIMGCGCWSRANQEILCCEACSKVEMACPRCGTMCSYKVIMSL